MRYAMQVMHEPDRMNLPYRDYIWQGGDYAVVLDDPNTLQNEEVREAWCFEYSEDDWLTGTTWIEAMDEATGSPTGSPTGAPIGRINCITGAAIP